jgi:hypothetical protein
MEAGPGGQRDPFPPVLLLMTTSETRAEAALRRFEQRWAQAQRHIHSSPYLAEEASVPEIAACAAARNADEAITEPVWLSSLGSDGLHLTDLLRPVWDRWTEQERARRELERRREQWRSELAADPERCREKMRQTGSSRHFEDLVGILEDNRCIALTILLARREVMTATERAAFAFFSRRLSWTRRGALTAHENPDPPSDDERRVAHNLAADYLDRQKRYVARLWARHPDCRAMMEAIEHLDAGRLLRADEINRLPVLIADHGNGASDLQARQYAYISWRDRAVERTRQQRRALVRLAFDRAGAASAFDLERLFYCGGCRQIVIPREPDLKGVVPPECSFCSLRAQTSLAEAVAEGLVRIDENGFWAVCHPPVPAWVTEEAARPLARSPDPHEEW